jgi:putative peptide zinc metalloprotease protein
MTLGRAPGSTVVLRDPAVSRHHARIRPAGARVVLEDAGSSYGTFVDGERIDGPVPLRDGSTIALGDTEVRVERLRGDAEAGRTIVVPAAGTVTALNAAAPRLRTGYALKRLDAREGEVVGGAGHGASFHRRGRPRVKRRPVKPSIPMAPL